MVNKSSKQNNPTTERNVSKKNTFSWCLLYLGLQSFELQRRKTWAEVLSSGGSSDLKLGTENWPLQKGNNIWRFDSQAPILEFVFFATWCPSKWPLSWKWKFVVCDHSSSLSKRPVFSGQDETNLFRSTASSQKTIVLWPKRKISLFLNEGNSWHEMLSWRNSCKGEQILSWRTSNNKNRWKFETRIQIVIEKEARSSLACIHPIPLRNCSHLHLGNVGFWEGRADSNLTLPQQCGEFQTTPETVWVGSLTQRSVSESKWISSSPASSFPVAFTLELPSRRLFSCLRLFSVVYTLAKKLLERTQNGRYPSKQSKLFRTFKCKVLGSCKAKLTCTDNSDKSGLKYVKTHVSKWFLSEW